MDSLPYKNQPTNSTKIISNIYPNVFSAKVLTTYMALLHSDPSKHSMRIMTTLYKLDIMHAWLGLTLNVVE